MKCLRSANGLQDFFVVTTDIPDGDEANAFLRPPLKGVSDDIVFIEFPQKPDISPNYKIAQCGMYQVNFRPW